MPSTYPGVTYAASANDVEPSGSVMYSDPLLCAIVSSTTSDTAAQSNDDTPRGSRRPGSDTMTW